MSEAEDPIRRKKRWEAFYAEAGGIKDMLAAIRAEYFWRLSDLDPWQVAPIANLAIAAKITEQLDGAIKAIIAEGSVGEHAKARIDKIQSLPDHKRRWAQGY